MIVGIGSTSTWPERTEMNRRPTRTLRDASKMNAAKKDPSPPRKNERSAIFLYKLFVGPLCYVARFITIPGGIVHSLSPTSHHQKMQAPPGNHTFQV